MFPKTRRVSSNLHFVMRERVRTRIFLRPKLFEDVALSFWTSSACGDPLAIQTRAEFEFVSPFSITKWLFKLYTSRGSEKRILLW